MATQVHGGAGKGLAYSWQGAELERSAGDILEAACTTLLDRTLRYMQATCPVDTGYLRSTAFAEVLRQGIAVALVVGAGASYAAFVELGTIHTEAQPFIRPAYDYLVSQLPAVLQAEAAARGYR